MPDDYTAIQEAITMAQGILALKRKNENLTVKVEELEQKIKSMRNNGYGERWHILATDPERPNIGEIVHIHTGETEYNQTYDGSFTKEVIAWQRWTKFEPQQ